MVKQAREQLESNQTQDDLRAVFEGSCKLIYVKPIVKECIKVVDDFIPELIEALSSQMNPQVVCSVAGLCNNEKIDQMIENYQTEQQSNTNTLSCESCGKIASVLTNKFHKTSRDDFLENILQICGKLSSFSDACANIVITHFNELHKFFMTNLNSNAVCHIGGVCAHKFHNHLEKEIEITPMSNVGFVKTTSDPDIPCELCEQLVNHLRDILVANTTEAEFKQVLEGVCCQTKSFKQECIAIVSQYYENIYEFLIKSLSPNDACFYIGICPKDFEAKKINVIAPIVSVDVQLPSYNHTKKSGDSELELKKIKEINQSKFSREQYHDPKKVILGFDEPFLTAEEILAAQLPIDRLMGAKNRKVLSESGAWCTMCEYILHFVQEELSDANNEEQIKKTVLSTCGKMPKSIAPECRNFVELYGDAIIALLIQEVDPATVCPQLKICPSNIGRETEVFAPNTVEIQVHSEASKKASCPLCLLAVEQAQQVIQNDKTIGKIKQVLEQLCSHLNNKLKMECNDFIETYSKELIDLLMKDFTPQEICVYLNLCSDKRPDLSNFGISMVIKNNKEQELTTNEIRDNTIDGIMISSHPRLELHNTPECLLCQEIVKQVEKNVVDKNSKIEIKKALEKACIKVPKKARSKCEDYVKKHGDQIAELIIEELSPKEICRDIQLCVAELGRSEIDHGNHSLIFLFTLFIMYLLFLVDIEDAIHVTVFTNVKSSSYADRQTSDMLKNSETCILCEMIVARMEKYLEKAATKEQVQEYLDHVCDILPSTIKSECVGFVNTYSTLILQTFESIPPKKICEQINLCSVTKIKSKGKVFETILYVRK